MLINLKTWNSSDLKAASCFPFSCVTLLSRRFRL